MRNYVEKDAYDILQRALIPDALAGEYNIFNVWDGPDRIQSSVVRARDGYVVITTTTYPSDDGMPVNSKTPALRDTVPR